MLFAQIMSQKDSLDNVKCTNMDIETLLVTSAYYSNSNSKFTTATPIANPIATPSTIDYFYYISYPNNERSF